MAPQEIDKRFAYFGATKCLGLAGYEAKINPTFSES